MKFIFLFFIFLFFLEILSKIFDRIYFSDIDYCYGKTGNRVKRNISDFSIIPCNNDIFRCYWIAVNYHLVKKKEDFLVAILLKWLHNGNIKIEKISNGSFFKIDIRHIVFIKSPSDTIELEERLYNYMYKASKNGKLNRKKFKKWCWENDVNIRRWFEEVLDFERRMLINENKISIREIKLRKLGNLLKCLVFDVDSSMMIEAEEVAGLKKYLNKVSSVRRKEFIDVNFLNDYVIYSQMFGIAGRVIRHFNLLYSETINDMDIDYNYGDIVFLNILVDAGVRTARSKSNGNNSSTAGGN